MTRNDRERIADALEALAEVAQEAAQQAGGGGLPPILRHRYVLPGLEPVRAAVRHLRDGGPLLQWSEREAKPSGIPRWGNLLCVKAKTSVGDYEITWWEHAREHDTYGVHFIDLDGKEKRIGGIKFGPETLEQAQLVAQNHFNDMTGVSAPVETSTISDVGVPQERDEAREILEDLLNAAHRGVYSAGFAREAVRRAERLLAPPEWAELDNDAWLEARQQHARAALAEKGAAVDAPVVLGNS